MCVFLLQDAPRKGPNLKRTPKKHLQRQTPPAAKSKQPSTPKSDIPSHFKPRPPTPTQDERNGATSSHHMPSFITPDEPAPVPSLQQNTIAPIITCTPPHSALEREIFGSDVSLDSSLSSDEVDAETQRLAQTIEQELNEIPEPITNTVPAISRKPTKPYRPRKYPCRICSTRFTRLTNLQRHVRTTHHAGRFKFLCYYCGYETSRNDNLKRHVMLNHEFNTPQSTTLIRPFSP